MNSLGSDWIRKVELSRPISIVIPVRDRKNNLMQCIQALQLQFEEQVEIVVVEHGFYASCSECSSIQGVRYFFLSSSTEFCKSSAVNFGVMAASNELVGFLDCDLIVQPSMIEEAIHRLSSCDFCFLLKDLRHLNDTSDGLSFSSHRRHDGFVGGCIIFNRKSFLNVGGFCEEFVGYGFEDVEFFNRISLCSNLYFDRKYDCAHIPHPKQEMGLFDNQSTWHSQMIKPMGKRINFCRDSLLQHKPKSPKDFSIWMLTCNLKKVLTHQTLSGVEFQTFNNSFTPLPHGFKPSYSDPDILGIEPGSYNCFLGHQRIFSKIGNEKALLVLEDDVAVDDPNWFKIIEESVPLLNEYDMVCFEGRNMDKPEREFTHCGRTWKVPSFRSASIKWVMGSTMSYLLSNRACKAASEFDYKGMPIDIVLPSMFPTCVVSESPFLHNRQHGSAVEGKGKFLKRVI